MVDLKVAPCSHEAAKYAVMNWHYSKAMPNSKLVKFGVWEKGRFIGAVIYGSGATPHLGSPYGLDQTQVCELVRVALTVHEAPVSEIVAKTLHLLKLSNPGLCIVVSFADPDEGHSGKIYQAGNWIYNGTSPSARFFKINGKKTHPRTIGLAGGIQSIDWVRTNLDKNAEVIVTAPKLRYLYPLNKSMRRVLNKIALPYPNAVEGLEASHLDSVKEVQVQSLPTALGGA